MSKRPSAPLRTEVLAQLFSSSQRRAVPVRTAFLQQGEGDGRVPGPLADLVRSGVPSRIEQYLLLLARGVGQRKGNGEMDYSVTLPARAWSRVLGLGEEQPGLRTVRRNWRALEGLGLVKVHPRGRVTVATPLKEDGSGEAYAHPAQSNERYLQVPYEFWTDGYADELKAPGWAMLLVALSLGDWFRLPLERGPDWYGIGSSTVERGVRELRRKQLMQVKYQDHMDFLADDYVVRENRYRLCPPLGPRGKFAKGASPALKAEPKPRRAPKPTRK